MTTIIGIYKLEFVGTDKCYIGQSRDILKRYSSHKLDMSKQESSKKLNEAYTLYGVPKLVILTECRESDLNIYELETIEIFDSINNGFNTMDSNNERPSLSGEYAPMAVCTNEQVIEAFTYLVDNPELSREYISKVVDISINIVRDIASGVSHKWLQKQFPDKYNKLINSIGKRNNGELNAYSKYSNKQIEEAFLQIINTDNSLKKISSDLEMDYNTIKSISSGSNHKWLKEKYPIEYSNMEKLKGTRGGKYTNAAAKNIVYPNIVSPEGIEYSVTNIREFARDNGLNQGHLGAVLRGKEKQHKGWKLAIK